jgi:bacterioferritin-associated ferredoxin
MYVCLCNGFTDRQVRGACASSPLRVAEVYPALGVRPICGKCAPTVRDVLRSADIARPLGLTESRTTA